MHACLEIIAARFNAQTTQMLVNELSVGVTFGSAKTLTCSASRRTVMVVIAERSPREEALS
jgi:hypothetical protein